MFVASKIILVAAPANDTGGGVVADVTAVGGRAGGGAGVGVT